MARVMEIEEPCEEMAIERTGIAWSDHVGLRTVQGK